MSEDINQKEKKEGFGSKIVNIFYKSYVPFLNGIAKFNSILFALYNTVITTFAIPVALIALIIVEVVRVQHGLRIIEGGDDTLALFGAVVLVMSNILVEAMIVNINWENGVRDETFYKTNLRSIFNNAVRFVVGEQELAEPAARFIRVQRIITLAILFTAFFGTINNFIDRPEYIDQPWHQVFITIILDAPISDFLSWTVTLLFTLVAVLASQRFAAYISFQALHAQEEIGNRAKEIIKQEAGERIVPFTQLAQKRYKLKEYLDVFTEDDLIKTKPNYSVYDSERDRWSKSYKTIQSLYNVIERLANKRREQNKET